MRYGIAVACLLATQAPTSSSAFQSAPNLLLATDLRGHSAIAQTRQTLFRHGVSAYVPAGDGGGVVNNPYNDNNATSTSVYLTNLVIDAVQTDDDAEEIELAERRRKITQRSRTSGTYRVTLPLLQQQDKTVSQPSGMMGMSIRQFYSGRDISNQILNVDTLVIETVSEEGSTGVKGDVNDSDSTGVETISAPVMQQRLAPNFSGVYVSSVSKGSPAWNAGIRPGDLLTSTGATFGEALWPKTTLEGVRSALSSRKMVSGSASFGFRRTDVQETDNVYELTLSRPIGLNLRETEDGYVEVVGFTMNAPTLVRTAVLIGDRVIAVDSSLGDQLWPVSTVEGVISACTSRLPGQQVTLRFERPEANVGDRTVMEKSMAAAAEATAMPKQQAEQQQKQQIVAGSEQEKVLLKRCRDVLRRYAIEEQALPNANAKQRTAKFVDKFAVPAMVADKVMDALAKSSVSLDSVTLSMTMDSYLSCSKPNEAIRAFETAVGVNGNGSYLTPKTLVEKEGDANRIQPNLAALNVYTISSLLKAHAMKRDLKSVRRVVAAMEGRGGEKVSGLETADWPGTGGARTIVPDTQCYNIAISAAAKSGSANGLQMVMQLFESLNDPSVIFKASNNGKPEKNAATYNSVISALTLAGNFEDSFNVFTNMKRVGLKPDKFTYTSLLKACVNDGDLQELLYDMKEQGVKEDVVMYNAMIRSLCEEGEMAEARLLVTQMEAKGIAPDSKTYGILMKGLLNAGKPGACFALFDSACNNVHTSQLSENVYLYTTAVTAASVMGDHERALDLVSRMSAIGIKPNTKTLTSLMGACLASERPDLAAEVYKRIEKPDGYAMSQGLEALCGAGDLLSAAKVLSTQQRGSRAMSGKELMQGYETIISTAVKCGDYDMARTMFTELLAKSFIPSKSTLRTIIASMGLSVRGQLVLEYEERDPEQFQYLLFMIDSIQQRKLHVDSYLYSAAIVCGNQLGDRHKALAQLLVQSRAASDESNGQVVLLNDEQVVEPLAVRWEELLRKKDTLQELSADPALLPSLKVAVAKRDSLAVVLAEKFMTRRRQKTDESAKTLA